MVVGIADLAAVEGETGRGQLSQKIWEDLKAARWAIGKLCGPMQRCLPMVLRDLVNEISKWAYDRVVSLVFARRTVLCLTFSTRNYRII